MPGDINGDEVVSIPDLLLAAGAFRVSPANLEWDPNADINEDGVANIMDLVIIAKNCEEILV
jgi:hypothetical protein